MIGQDFPVSDYYRENIRDAVTVSRKGTWWSAILLIEDPKTKKNFISLYKWQKSEDAWKVRQKFIIRGRDDASKFADAVNTLAEKL